MSGIWRPSLADLVVFMNAFPLCALGTSTPYGRPTVSTVAFSAHEDLSLMFGTSTRSRKAERLRDNHWVAVTVTNAEDRLTVQYEGLAYILSDAEYGGKRERHYRKLPASLPFEGQPDQVFYGIRPTLIRASDCNPTPWVVTEFSEHMLARMSGSHPAAN